MKISDNRPELLTHQLPGWHTRLMYPSNISQLRALNVSRSATTLERTARIWAAGICAMRIITSISSSPDSCGSGAQTFAFCREAFIGVEHFWPWSVNMCCSATSVDAWSQSLVHELSWTACEKQTESQTVEYNVTMWARTIAPVHLLAPLYPLITTLHSTCLNKNAVCGEIAVCM